MEYLKTISIPAHNTSLYGKPVSGLIAPGMRVQDNGAVKGRFYYVNAYTGFSSNKEEQEGYYFPFRLTAKGEKMSFVKNGVVKKNNISFEEYNVFRVTKDDKFAVMVDGVTVAKFDFSQAVFEEKKGDKKMNAGFFNEGACGIAQTGYIGTLNKDSGTSDVVFDKALPDGCRVVNVVIVPSEDVGEGVTLSVGNGSDSSAYVSEESLTAGKTVVKDAGYVAVTENKVAAKLGKSPEAGTVDVFVTVIRLEV